MDAGTMTLLCLIGIVSVFAIPNMIIFVKRECCNKNKK